MLKPLPGTSCLEFESWFVASATSAGSRGLHPTSQWQLLVRNLPFVLVSRTTLDKIREQEQLCVRPNRCWSGQSASTPRGRHAQMHLFHTLFLCAVFLRIAFITMKSVGTFYVTAPPPHPDSHIVPKTSRSACLFSAILAAFY